MPSTRAWLKTIRDYVRLRRKRLRFKHPAFNKTLRYLNQYANAADIGKSLGSRVVMHPRLDEATPQTPFDPHYFYQDVWAFRRIHAQNPAQHIDIGSRIILVGILSCVVPVEFVDIRPLTAVLPDLSSKAGDVLNLPYPDQSISSLSCLHVVEHVGLGRYGDALDIPDGTRRACAELQRVLAPNGYLYFGLPCGKHNIIEFNAHRVHTVDTILSYFPELELVELSGVTDDAQFIENIAKDILNQQHYGCGLFIFTRKS
jgi:hypothetical protein